MPALAISGLMHCNKWYDHSSLNKWYDHSNLLAPPRAPGSRSRARQAHTSCCL